MLKSRERQGCQCKTSGISGIFQGPPIYLHSILSIEIGENRHQKTILDNASAMDHTPHLARGPALPSRICSNIVNLRRGHFHKGPLCSIINDTFVAHPLKHPYRNNVYIRILILFCSIPATSSYPIPGPLMSIPLINWSANFIFVLLFYYY